MYNFSFQELEDRLSLDKVSEDSFTLDKQIASWKLDDHSMHDHLKRIEREHHEMEVIHMKMNLIKQYVRKHGVKQINKDTFIDPFQKNVESTWHEHYEIVYKNTKSSQAGI